MFSFPTLHGVKGQPLPIHFKHLPGVNRDNMPSKGPYLGTLGIDLEKQCAGNKEILACFLKIIKLFSLNLLSTKKWDSIP